jgi:hypothetical protein
MVYAWRRVRRNGSKSSRAQTTAPSLVRRRPVEARELVRPLALLVRLCSQKSTRRRPHWFSEVRESVLVLR